MEDTTTDRMGVSPRLTRIDIVSDQSTAAN